MSAQSPEVERVRERSRACLAKAKEALDKAICLQEASKMLREQSTELVLYAQLLRKSVPRSTTAMSKGARRGD